MLKKTKIQKQQWSGAEISSGFDKVDDRRDLWVANVQDFRTGEMQFDSEAMQPGYEEKETLQDTRAQGSHEDVMRTLFTLQAQLDRFVKSGFHAGSKETREVVVPIFTGVDLRPWIDWMENHFESIDCTEVQKLNISQCFMEDEAKSWLQERQGWFPFKTWASMKEGLLLRFGEHDDLERIRICLENEEIWKNWTQKLEDRVMAKDRVTIDQNSESLVEKAMETQKETQSCQEKEILDIQKAESVGRLKTIQEKENNFAKESMSSLTPMQETTITEQRSDQLNKVEKIDSQTQDQDMIQQRKSQRMELTDVDVPIEQEAIHQQQPQRKELTHVNVPMQMMKFLKSWKYKFKKQESSKNWGRRGTRENKRQRKYCKDWKFKFRDRNLDRIWSQMNRAARRTSCYYTNVHKHNAATKAIQSTRKTRKSSKSSFDAHQLFGEMLFPGRRKQQKSMQRKFLKTWKFRFKYMSLQKMGLQKRRILRIWKSFEVEAVNVSCLWGIAEGNFYAGVFDFAANFADVHLLFRTVSHDVVLTVGFYKIMHTWRSQLKIMVIWVEIKSSEEAIAGLRTQQQWLLKILCDDQLSYQLQKQIFPKDWFFKYKHETCESEKLGTEQHKGVQKTENCSGTREIMDVSYIILVGWKG